MVIEKLTNHGSLPTTRDSALAFTEGVRGGWLASDLLAWVDEHLLRPGRLVVPGGGSLERVCEHDVGTVMIRPAWATEPAGRVDLAISAVPRLLETCRQRVLEVLRKVIETGQMDFVNAALFGGRVVRGRESRGHGIWNVSVSADMALSEQILALFAADALERPDDYAHDLSVCDACGAVTIEPLPGGSRHGCPAHLFGGSEAVEVRMRTGTFLKGTAT